MTHPTINTSVTSGYMPPGTSLDEIPEYRPYGGYFGFYPEPEPEKARGAQAGKDPSTTTHHLLALADEIIAAQRDETRLLDDALSESWTLIRELRAQLAAQSEQIAALTEYADALVASQSPPSRGYPALEVTR